MTRESGRHALASGRSAVTLNDLETAGPSFDDERACMELTLLDTLCCRCTKLFDPGSRTTRPSVPRDVTTLRDAGVDNHSASAQSPMQLISAHFRRSGAKQLIIYDSRVRGTAGR